ncbi:TIGR03936 family radical SAM-associated protein [Natronincola ferrireducens]|uniref:Radical SAM-linked protein n=1 Tax=Natronincola ferrireducens TaxID=393762 RepID=A0A1G9D282_9FIRM|nr:TIGR03936 family radical SAM-associated protein [Natronincola ferrireducens]SDK57804.1 radical SAM-linked protein [Natronincola ferrireducens]
MHRIRSRFYKKGDMVFISHLDLIRLFERAFRRANIAISYTQGYNPHPIMSFATALAIGVASEGEYIDIEITEPMDLEDFANKLNKVLPEGLRIIKSQYIPKNADSLMSIIKYSIYSVKVIFSNQTTEEVLKEELKGFLNLEEIIDIKEKKRKNNYKKSNKSQVQRINIRDYIHDIEVIEVKENIAIIKMILATGSTGNLKPETVINKLDEMTKLDINKDKVRIHRHDLLTKINPAHLTPLDDIEI